MTDTAHPQVMVQGPPPADPLWDDWETPPRLPTTATAPELHFDGFDGPLDLLLDLAERQRIDLGRISMLQLVEQFGAALDRLGDRVPLERRADWLVLVTRLVLLRSRLLLPASPEVAAAAEAAVVDEAARLERLLQVRAAARWLEGRPQLDRDVFEPPPAFPPVAASRLELFEACLLVLRGPRRPPEPAAVFWPALFRPWPVDQAMRRMVAILAEEPGPLPLRRFLPEGIDELDGAAREMGQGPAALRRRAAVASVFQAGLELVRQDAVVAEQDAEGEPSFRQAVTVNP